MSVIVAAMDKDTDELIAEVREFVTGLPAARQDSDDGAEQPATPL